jgi:hypothetical protein
MEQQNIKILNQVLDIINKHDFKPIEIPSEFTNLYVYKDKNPLDATCYYDNAKDDIYFMKKYCNHIPIGWYGFSIGTPIIPEWLEIIDSVLDVCINNDPNFEIYQIKLKFGGIRFYVHSEIIEDINDVGFLLEKLLFDKALIY